MEFEPDDHYRRPRHFARIAIMPTLPRSLAHRADFCVVRQGTVPIYVQVLAWELSSVPSCA